MDYIPAKDRNEPILVGIVGFEATKTPDAWVINDPSGKAAAKLDRAERGRRYAEGAPS